MIGPRTGRHIVVHRSSPDAARGPGNPSGGADEKYELFPEGGGSEDVQQEVETVVGKGPGHHGCPQEVMVRLLFWSVAHPYPVVLGDSVKRTTKQNFCFGFLSFFPFCFLCHGK